MWEQDTSVQRNNNGREEQQQKSGQCPDARKTPRKDRRARGGQGQRGGHSGDATEVQLYTREGLPAFLVIRRLPGAGAPPLAKVMRKAARHTQRRDRASGVRPDILEHFPPQNQSLPTLCFVLSPTPLTLRGAVPHYLSLKKELAYSSS